MAERPYRPCSLMIDRCQQHNYWAISVGDQHSSIRLTPTKCCGCWQIQYEFRLTIDELRRAISEMQSELRRIEEADRG